VLGPGCWTTPDSPPFWTGNIKNVFEQFDKHVSEESRKALVIKREAMAQFVTPFSGQTSLRQFSLVLCNGDSDLYTLYDFDPYVFPFFGWLSTAPIGEKVSVG
jgi:hypothetical protein